MARYTGAHFAEVIQCRGCGFKSVSGRMCCAAGCRANICPFSGPSGRAERSPRPVASVRIFTRIRRVAYETAQSAKSSVLRIRPRWLTFRRPAPG